VVLTVILALAPTARASAASFVVNSELDLDGSCSPEFCTLRQAINSANANPGRDRVVFDIAPAGPHSITVLTALPPVTETAVFNAMTQPGFAGRPLIELDGHLISSGNGFTLDAGSDVRGFVINRFSGGAGISVSHMEFVGSQTTLVADNYIGTDRTGALPAGNRIGVELLGGSGFIGQLNAYLPDDPPAGRNVISANTRAGVFISDISEHNAIAGNLIGTNAAGDTAIGNGIGIEIENGSGTFIGGNTQSGGARNTISGNGVGVYVSKVGEGFHGATLYNNNIGTDVTGTHPLGNTGPGIWAIGGAYVDIGFPDDAYTNVISGNGGDAVRLDGASCCSIYDNRIGTDRSGTHPIGNHGAGIALLNNTNGIIIGGFYGNVPNIISANEAGVKIVNSFDNVLAASLIGTDAGGNPLGNLGAGVEISGSRNLIGPATIAFNGGPGIRVLSGFGNSMLSGNSIYENGGLGIDLSPAGVNVNDRSDLDNGANGLQNYPKLEKAMSRALGATITGVLFSEPNTTYNIDLYTNPACDPSQFGEGQRWISSSQVTTNKNGMASLTFEAVDAHAGDAVTATATDPNGNTSEFSNCIAVRGSP